MYSKSKEKFDLELFRAPTSEYRGVPFWAWTGKPEKHVMAEQILEFDEMGFGGFFVHSRVGLDMEFLGEEFLEDIAFCREKGAEKGLYTCLYDEDKWPSGFGGGRVTEDPQYASRYLLLSPNKIEGSWVNRQAKGHTRLSDSGEVELLKRFNIVLKNGKLKSYAELEQNQTGEHEWYLYLVISRCLDWFNGRQYVNVLNSKSAQRFIETTYEKYSAAFEKDFGKNIPVIFTDEPSYKRYEMMENSLEPSEVGFPYSEDIEVRYMEKYGESFLSRVPELAFNTENGVASEVRYRYFNICSELFSEDYIGDLGRWCAQKGIALTGHFQDENSLELQAKACGDVMRAMAGLDVPGVDVLLDGHEFFTLKQAQSVTRQLGKAAQSAELYGVTNWDFDLASHKHQGDWVTALGNTMRIPHLCWMSMKGEMKRDFPASINHCSPWYKKYRLIEDHYARLAVTLTRGKPVVRIAVLDPVESMWMLLGPDNENKVHRDALSKGFHSLCERLLFAQVDFDLLNEALLQDIGKVSNGHFVAGNMEYDVVILPDLCTIRGTTLELLKAFSEDGGKILVTGQLPQYVDGLRDDYAGSVLKKCVEFATSEQELLAALQNERDLAIEKGGELIYQLRQEDHHRWLFIAHGKKPENEYEDIVLRIKGIWCPELFHTDSGDVRMMLHSHRDGETLIPYQLFADDSLLIRLLPEKKAEIMAVPETAKYRSVTVPKVVSYSLEEPNVMLLDMVYFRVDNGPWQGPEEILKADTQIRSELGYRLRTEGKLQPWCLKDRTRPHKVELRYSFRSEITCECRPAVECEDDWDICLNGKPLRVESDVWFVDRAIKYTEAGHVVSGENEVYISLPFGEHTDLEAVYLTGSFGVVQRVDEEKPVMTELPETVSFGSVTKQGLMFYGGNISYHLNVETKADSIRIRLPEYVGAMAEINVDGRRKDLIQKPHEVVFNCMKPGEHRIELKIFGNRFNTFGHLHNAVSNLRCAVPASYRTEGDAWTYGYAVKNFGLLAPPEIGEVL